MAKSGTIKIPDATEPGDSAIADAVVQSEAPTMNLGAVAARVLEVATEARLVTVDMTNRRVGSVPVTGGSFTPGSGAKLIGTLIRDDPTKRVSPWSLSGGDSLTGDAAAIAFKAAIEASLAEVKPARSLASQISAIEDALAGLETAPGSNVTVHVTQEDDGEVKVYVGAASLDVGIGSDGEIAIIEQVLPTTTTAEALAFE